MIDLKGLLKSGSFKAILGVLTLSLLFVPLSSLAAWPDTPPTVSASFNEGQIGYFQENGLYKYRLWVEAYHYAWSEYRLYLFEASSSSSFSITLYHKNNSATSLEFNPSTEVNCTYTVVYLNGSTGASNSFSRGPDAAWCNLIPQFGSAQWRAGEFSVFLYDGLDHSNLYNDYFLSTQFITFTPDVPDQVQYRSYLPEPSWDTHNRYFVANDKLYWISYYLDNLWVNPVTGSPVIRDDDLTAFISGTASDPNDGDLYYNYNMSVSYQDKEYYCVQYNSIDYSFEDMCAPCLIYSSSGVRLAFSFDQLSSIYSSIQDILVDYRIYASSFDLITGEYIESVYSANGQVGSDEINISLSFDDELINILCYGVNFVNSQNLPVNLASVIWSYDLDFYNWRTDMYSKLDAIYQLLSQSETPTTTEPVDYAGMLTPDPTLGDYQAEDAGELLSGAVSDVEANLGDGMEWGKNQLTDFVTGVPELFIVVILALSFGLVSLILGKKKSDS